MTDSDLHREGVITVEVGGIAELPPTGYQLRVLIIDDSLADAEHPTIAVARVEEWSGSTVELRMNAPGWEAERWTVFAHAGRSADIGSGDWITTVATPITQQHVAIQLERIE